MWFRKKLQYRTIFSWKRSAKQVGMSDEYLEIVRDFTPTLYWGGVSTTWSATTGTESASQGLNQQWLRSCYVAAPLIDEQSKRHPPAAEWSLIWSNINCALRGRQFSQLGSSGVRCWKACSENCVLPDRRAPIPILGEVKFKFEFIFDT